MNQAVVNGKDGLPEGTLGELVVHANSKVAIVDEWQARSVLYM